MLKRESRFMNKNVKFFGALLALLILAVSIIVFRNNPGEVEERAKVDKKIQIVTSFYPVYLAALNLTDGINTVSLEGLSEPQTGCLHDYQLTPEDMRLLSRADVFIVNGGGIESYLTEVTEAYKDLQIIDLSAELNLTQDAHAWMNLGTYERQIRSMEAKLVSLDKNNAEAYHQNADRYCNEIAELVKKADSLKEKTAGKRVGVLHEAFEYLALDYEMDNCFSFDLHEEEHSSAGEIKDVIEIIQDNQIKIVFADEEYGREAAALIEKETDCKVYFLDPIVAGEPVQDSYRTAMEKNINILTEIFAD